MKKFIKRTNEGYAPKEATILAQPEIIEFGKTVPPNFLLNKIIQIFAFTGAMRKIDLFNQSCDVKDEGDKIKVCFREAKI